MTFEEILPRLKAGHTCYRMSQHGLGLGDVKTNVDIRPVLGAYGGEFADVIGFVELTCSRGAGHFDIPAQRFSTWGPTVDDVLASDWEDATADREAYEKRQAAEAEAIEAAKADPEPATT